MSVCLVIYYNYQILFISLQKKKHISQRQEGERKQYVRKVSKGAMGSWARSGRADPAREPGAHIEQARET